MGVASEAQLAEMLERARKKLELLQRRGGKNTVARTVSQGWDLWPFESGRAKGCLRWHEMQLAEMLERVRKNVDTIIREPDSVSRQHGPNARALRTKHGIEASGHNANWEEVFGNRSAGLRSPYRFILK